MLKSHEGDANSAAYEKPKPGRKRSSPVWDYFTSVEKDLTSCNLCGATVRCPKSGTSTMIHHLQSAHPGEYGEMLMKTSQKVKSEANKASSLDLGELKKQGQDSMCYPLSFSLFLLTTLKVSRYMLGRAWIGAIF